LSSPAVKTVRFGSGTRSQGRPRNVPPADLNCGRAI
jgi:hypothetical protein